jgi:hypothetical protein
MVDVGAGDCPFTHLDFVLAGCFASILRAGDLR